MNNSNNYLKSSSKKRNGNEYVLKLHGSMLSNKFKIPQGKTLVFLTPPNCSLYPKTLNKTYYNSVMKIINSNMSFNEKLYNIRKKALKSLKKTNTTIQVFKEGTFCNEHLMSIKPGPNVNQIGVFKLKNVSSKKTVQFNAINNVKIIPQRSNQSLKSGSYKNLKYPLIFNTNKFFETRRNNLLMNPVRSHTPRRFNKTLANSTINKPTKGPVFHKQFYNQNGKLVNFKNTRYLNASKRYYANRQMQYFYNHFFLLSKILNVLPDGIYYIVSCRPKSPSLNHLAFDPRMGPQRLNYFLQNIGMVYHY